jgi:hypothetical protein
MFAFEEIGLKEFEKDLEDGNIIIYIFYDLSEKSRRDDYDIYKIAIYLITVKFSLPPEYKNYRNVFSPIKCMEIAENPQTAYIINLKENIIALYKLIYYFSEKKLRVLREYLKES